MPMKKRFYHIEGQMVGYDEGGVRKDFLTDHLGSVIAEVDQDENVTYQARYSAFGQPKSSTGTGCGFGWVGSYGYRETGLPHMSHYVRARHYSEVTGNWSTVDPLWPEESAYGYVGGRVTRWTDPRGASPGGDLQNCINSWVRLEYSAQSACNRCKVAQNYKGGYRCENLLNNGKAVPPWAPPSPTCSVGGAIGLGAAVILPFDDWIYAGGMGYGSHFDFIACEASCIAACSSTKVGKKLCKKNCTTLCHKFAQGGCLGLEAYCDTLCTGGRKNLCEACLGWFNRIGCPGRLVSP